MGKARMRGSRYQTLAQCEQAAAARIPAVTFGEKPMDASMEDPQSGKSRKNKPAKLPSRKSTAKVKVSLMLTDDVDFRLTVHAAALKLDRRRWQTSSSMPPSNASLFRTGGEPRTALRDAEEGRGEDAA